MAARTSGCGNRTWRTPSWRFSASNVPHCLSSASDGASTSPVTPLARASRIVPARRPRDQALCRWGARRQAYTSNVASDRGAGSCPVAAAAPRDRTPRSDTACTADFHCMEPQPASRRTRQNARAKAQGHLGYLRGPRRSDACALRVINQPPPPVVNLRWRPRPGRDYRQDMFRLAGAGRNARLLRREAMVLVVEISPLDRSSSAKALRFVLRRLSQEHVLAVVTTGRRSQRRLTTGGGG